MKRLVNLAQKLDKSSFKEEAEQIIDFGYYFENEDCLEKDPQAQQLIEQIAEILEEAIKQNQGYFNFYMSSYFKGQQKDPENKMQISTNLKQLCVIIYNSKSEIDQNSKGILISEYFSLHHLFTQIQNPNNDFLNKKKIHSFKSLHTQDFYNKCLKDVISQQGNNEKILWNEFKQLFVNYLKEFLGLKSKEYNLGSLVSYLKSLIDIKQDNTIDLEELDEFFHKYLNQINGNQITQSVLYKIVNKYVNNNITMPQLQIEFIKYPQKFINYYERNKKQELKYQLDSFRDKTILGRTQQQLFCPDDQNISRQQFQIIKDDMQNYYLENINLNLNMNIKITNIPYNVRKGFIYMITKKDSVQILDISPQHEEFQNGRNLVHPVLDYPFVELKSNHTNINKFQENEEQKQPQIQFKYNGTIYHCQTKKFTIGKSLSDDIQIGNAENTQLEFQYIDNYGWIVFEPQPSNQGTYFRANQLCASEIDDSIMDQDIDFNATTKKHLIHNPKFLIFHGMTITFAEYQATFSFIK